MTGPGHRKPLGNGMLKVKYKKKEYLEVLHEQRDVDGRIQQRTIEIWILNTEAWVVSEEEHDESEKI